MKKARPAFSLGSAAMPTIVEPALTQPAEIVGTWKFLAYLRTDPITGKSTNVFGERIREGG